MFSRELVYVLSAIVINNVVITAIIVINMRRIVAFVREQVVKVQMSQSDIFEYADTYIGFHKDALNTIDEEFDNIKNNLQSLGDDFKVMCERTRNIEPYFKAANADNSEAELYNGICNEQQTIGEMAHFMASQKVHNLAYDEYIARLDRSIANINANVARSMREHDAAIARMMSENLQNK
jgi:hypothetical protein